MEGVTEQDARREPRGDAMARVIVTAYATFVVACLLLVTCLVLVSSLTGRADRRSRERLPVAHAPLSLAP